MTAVMCILGPMALPLPVSPVPISLTNLVLYFMIYILGTKLSLISLGDISASGRCGPSCVLRLCRRPWEAGRPHRRLSSGLCVHDDDLWLCCGAVSWEACDLRSWHDPGDCRMLSVWDRLAGGADVPVLSCGSGDRGDPLSSWGCGKDHPGCGPRTGDPKGCKPPCNGLAEDTFLGHALLGVAADEPWILEYPGSLAVCSSPFMFFFP